MLFITMGISNTLIADPSTATVPDFSAYLVPKSPTLDSKAYVLIDPYSGQVLAEKNLHTQLPPASLTKLMSLYLVFQELGSGRIQLTTMVPISVHAWKAEGSRMFVKVGTKVSVEDLILGTTVQSGNDATLALAEYIGGTEGSFVEMMNNTAAQLGMRDSHFLDPSGLSNKTHLTTAYDLSLLASALIEDYPQYYHFFGQKWFTWNGIRQPNRNRLLWRDLSVDGLKTGHTDEAGYCLISSSLQNGSRFVAVILGAKNEVGLLHPRCYVLFYILGGSSPAVTMGFWFGLQLLLLQSLSLLLVFLLLRLTGSSWQIRDSRFRSHCCCSDVPR